MKYLFCQQLIIFLPRVDCSLHFLLYPIISSGSYFCTHLWITFLCLYFGSNNNDLVSQLFFCPDEFPAYFPWFFSPHRFSRTPTSIMFMKYSKWEIRFIQALNNFHWLAVRQLATSLSLAGGLSSLINLIQIGNIIKFLLNKFKRHGPCLHTPSLSRWLWSCSFPGHNHCRVWADRSQYQNVAVSFWPSYYGRRKLPNMNIWDRVSPERGLVQSHRPGAQLCRNHDGAQRPLLLLLCQVGFSDKEIKILKSCCLYYFTFAWVNKASA